MGWDYLKIQHYSLPNLNSLKTWKNLKNKRLDSNIESKSTNNTYLNIIKYSINYLKNKHHRIAKFGNNIDFEKRVILSLLEYTWKNVTCATLRISVDYPRVGNTYWKKIKLPKFRKWTMSITKPIFTLMAPIKLERATAHPYSTWSCRKSFNSLEYKMFLLCIELSCNCLWMFKVKGSIFKFNFAL